MLNALVERNGLDPAEVEDVQMGCVSQVGEQGWNIGRMAPLVAGWPESVPGTHRRPAVRLVDAVQLQRRGRGLVGPARPRRLGRGRDRCRACRWARAAATSADELLERWEIVPQGISAELIAEEWGLSREELDAYSYESHRRALAAIDEGRFENEVVPVEVSNPHAGVALRRRRDAAGRHLARRRWRR